MADAAEQMWTIHFPKGSHEKLELLWRNTNKLSSVLLTNNFNSL